MANIQPDLSAVDPGGLSGHMVRGAIDMPQSPEGVAHSTTQNLEETVRQAGDFALRALDLTGQALGNAVDVVSDRAFQEAGNVGVNIATPSAQAATESVFSWSGYVQALGIMCLLLAALWFGVWAMRRYGKFNFMPRPGSLPKDSLIMETQMPLGPRKGLMVVKFMGRRLLLGVTDQQITLITEEGSREARQQSKFDGLLEDAANSDSGRPAA